MIEAAGLSFSHPGRPGHRVFGGLDFSVRAGDACAIIGPSGCGKTTLLHLLAGLLPPGSGSLRIGGRSLNGPRPRTAIILQQLGLFPWKTVAGNLALGLAGTAPAAPAAPFGRVAARARRNSEHATMAARLGLAGLERRWPHQLSGGQRQRVAIGRALLAQPDLLLMDEAASALDALSREALQDLILELWQAGGLTLVLVTHSIEEAVVLGRSLLVMDQAGRLEPMGNPVPAAPGHPREHPAFAETCRRLRARLAAAAGPAGALP
jgi:NitT/TauT family transport system ATP-binding protein